MAQINKPNEYFNTVLYTGNDTGQSITGVGFQPDFTWIKSRTDTNSHNAWDSVRGVNKYLEVDTTKIETTVANGVTSFDSDGFTVGSRDAINDNGLNFVSWNWLGSNGTASNTDGSITSTVSANTTSGFSIVKWYGTGANATIGHGLGVAPSVVITKNLDASANWIYGGDNIGWTKYLIPNLTNAVATANNAWNDTAPNSTVVSLGSSTVTNASANMIAYCFAEKKGFSKFGSYIGNGNADGTFVYTGFKPAFVLTKNTTTGHGWWILDNKRDIDNPVTQRLQANNSNAESSTEGTHDFLSNGFKLRRGDYGDLNENGAEHIYMAFAESPLVGTNNIPATAR